MSNPAHNFSVTASRVVAASRVIGEVLAASGSCRLTRADVGAIQVRVGDSVYQGDLIETAADGRIIIRFLDGTTFDLCDNARMELDEFVCNSDGTPHSGLLTLARGAFRLIAGHMVKAGRLRIDTPVASIRGRGPAGAFGSLSLTALILSVISEAQASSDHTSQHNDVIAYKDLDLNGNFDLTLPNGTVVNVGDPGETVTITDSLDITYSTNSSSQMEDYQSAQRETVSYLSLGLSGPTSTGPIGSPTLFGNPPPLQPINFTPPDPNQTLPPIFNTSPQPGANPPDPAGVRHAPVLTAAAADLIETNAGLKISGAITVTDLDNDIIGVSVTSVAVDETNSTGPVDGRPDIPTLKAMLSLAQGTIVAAPSAQLGWSFDSGPEAFNYLAKDETLILVYQVRGSDFVEADTKTVTITITGTNDRPVITSTDSELSGTITETTGQTGVPTEHSVGGVLNYAELDVTDLDHINHGNATAVWIDRFGTSHTVTDSAIIDAGRLAFGLVDQDLNSATWTYTVADDVLDFLAAGESLTVTYIINVQDDSGDAATATSTTRQIVINFSQLPNTGTNDRPVITSTVGELSDTIIETVAQTDDPTDHSVDGVVNYTDVDVTDVDHINHTTATAVWTHRDNTTSNVSDTDIIGAGRLVFGSVNQNLNTATWTYTVADNELDFLGADETLVVTYDITVQDDSGSANDTSLPRQITVTITGTNDRPVISVTDVAGAVIEDANIVADNPNTAAVETGSFLHDTGSISFTDVDTTDLSAATVALTGTPSTTGPAIPAALSAALANAVLLSGATNAHSGTVDWSFALDDSLVQYLANGETVTATYTISVKDDSGNAANDTATQTVTVTITGTNDRPVISVTDVAGAVIEDANIVADNPNTAAVETGSFLHDTGSISFTDVDTTDLSAATVALTGTPSTTGPAIPAALSTALANAVLLSGATTNAHSGTVDWSFALDDSLVQYLAKGETVTATYTISVKDDSGDAATDTATQTVTVTITGTNDTPVLAAVTGPTHTDTTNDDTFAAATGTLTSTDVDVNDSATYGIDTGTTGGNTNLGGVIYDVSKAGTYGTLYVNSTTGAWRFETNDGAIEGLKGDTTENFTVKVTDGSGATASQIFTVTLDGANDTPVLAAVTGPTYTDTANDDTFAATTGTLARTDRDTGDTATYGIDTGTTGGNTNLGGVIYDVSKAGTYGTLYVNSTTGAWRFEANDGAIEGLNGDTTENFTVKVTDGSGATASQTFTATLDGANDTPVAVADTIYTNVGFGDSISVNDAWLLLNDTDRDSSTLTISSVADGFIADASHSGTTTTVTPNVLPPIFPVFPFFGASAFTYTVSDGSLTSAATTVTIHRGFHNATITGGSGNDILIEGRNTATTLDGGTGLDIIIGGGAGDTIIGVQDDILLDGRGGTDVLKVDENFTSTSDSQIVNIEKILLTDDVTLNISNQTEGFIITSSSGADTITGGAGGDTIVARIDNVRDVIDGGAGSDTADYSAYTAGLTVTLNGATPAIVVGSSVPGNDIVHADTIANIENFVGGSRKDVVTGDGNANVITGGGGGDLLAGGGGSDTFVFKSVSNSSPGTTGGNPNYDVISDFVHGSDFLDFSAISGLNSAVQPVIIQSASAPTTIAAHTIDIVTSGGNTVIYANASNVSHTIGAADIEIHLSNVTNVTASDFILHH